MIRRAAVIVLALTFNPALLRAQDTTLTVIVPSAEVYKGPSNVTPVVGHVPQGTVLPIARNLGSWVKIAWPDGLDGFGYVHVTMIRIGPATDANVTSHAPATTSPTRQTPATNAPSTRRTPTTGASTPRTPVPRVQGTLSPASHMLGLGALVGYTRSVGATARAWHDNHLGFQFSITRNTLTSSLTSSTATATQMEPGFVYGLFDRVTDYVWIRPYVGSAVSFRLQSASPQFESDSSVGLRLFGGGEFMFASAPQIGVSADLGYRRFPTTFPAFESKPLAVTIAGHWYIR